MAKKTICDICGGDIPYYGSSREGRLDQTTIALYIDATSRTGENVVVCSKCADRAKLEFVFSFADKLKLLQERAGQKPNFHRNVH